MNAARPLSSEAAMTIESFEDQLTAVKGKIRHVNMWNHYDRYHDGLLYYWNNAENLRKSANIVWDNQILGNEIALMLAGLSIEILLKGTILALQEVFPHCHRLECLIATAGISVNDRDHQTSRLLTEYIVWAARYPTPKGAEEWFLEETGGWPLSLAPEERGINKRGDYENLWSTLCPYFWRVQKETFESAELDIDSYGTLKERPKLKHVHAPRRVESVGQ
jgi:hypothetical protein